MLKYRHAHAANIDFSGTNREKKNKLFNMSGDDEKREGVLRSGKFYFDRAWNDPPEFKHDAQAKAAAATATGGTGGQKLNKRVGHALGKASLPPPPSTPLKADGDVPKLPNLQDAGAARSLADLPPPPPPLSSSQTSRPGSLPTSVDHVATSPAASNSVDVDVDVCVANLETAVDKNTSITEAKRKDIKKRIAMMATKWKSGSLNRNVESGMGRVSLLLADGDSENTALAAKKLQELMVDFPSHCNPWAVGIKHLITSAKPEGADQVPQKGIANPLK